MRVRRAPRGKGAHTRHGTTSLPLRHRQRGVAACRFASAREGAALRGHLSWAPADPGLRPGGKGARLDV
ncbi:hypothetical protein ACFU5O_18775 [Streptomyces sp. NPDC057445]|uniref:hypothetical protein n=1 Tax=Streptomyces sp. NPDC057445 TaxID=3346136 RepID=UPI0036D142D9